MIPNHFFILVFSSSTLYLLPPLLSLQDPLCFCSFSFTFYILLLDFFPTLYVPHLSFAPLLPLASPLLRFSLPYLSPSHTFKIAKYPKVPCLRIHQDEVLNTCMTKYIYSNYRMTEYTRMPQPMTNHKDIITRIIHII